MGSFVDFRLNLKDEDVAIGIVSRLDSSTVLKKDACFKDSIDHHSCTNQIVCRRKPAHKSNRQQKQKSFCHHFLCLLLVSPLPVAQSLLVEVPRNTVVWQHGSSEPIIMPCKSDNASLLIWRVKKYPNSDKKTLYNGYYLNPDAKSYCTVKADEPGKNQLHLKNREEIAQTYICLEPGTLAEASADLIWMGNYLMCIDKSTDDLVNLKCSIEFRGNWAPTMEWKELSNDRGASLIVEGNTTTVSDQRVTSTLVKPLQKGSRNYTCTVKFVISDKPITTTATNIPSYQQHWSSSVFTKLQDEELDEPVKTVITVTIAAVACMGAILIIVAALLVNKNRRKAKKEEKKRKKQQMSLRPRQSESTSSVTGSQYNPYERRVLSELDSKDVCSNTVFVDVVKVD